MASFVEQATLRLVDQTSGPARSIQASLKELFSTAKKLKKTELTLAVKSKGLKEATSQLTSYKKNVAALGSVKSINGPSVNTAQVRSLNGLTRALSAYSHAVAQLPKSPVINPRITPPAPPRKTTTSVPSVPGNSGGFLNVGPANTNLALLSVAAYGAAEALRSIITNAAKSDRAGLQATAQASPAQRAILAQSAERPAGATAIALTKSERQKLQVSLLGDVQGSDTQRAMNAAKVTQDAEVNVLPRLYAQNPNANREDIVAELRKFYQAMNLASTDIIDSAGNFTAEGNRVKKGIMLAMAADPDLSPGQIKTAMANAKTAGLTLSPEGIAAMLINTGSRGQRAANETFRAMRSAGGTVDNKALNNSLAEMGLLLDTQRNKKGNVIAGSGTALDQNLLNTDPALWLDKNYRPVMEKRLKEQQKDPSNSVNMVAQINKDFAGISSAGLQGITDMLLGFQQMRSSIAQAQVGINQPITPALEQSFVAQSESVGTAWKDRAAEVGTAFMKAINAPQLLSDTASLLRGDPTDPKGLAAAGLATGAAGLALVASLRAAFGASGVSLARAGISLQGSAVALMRAALVQNGARGLPVPMNDRLGRGATVRGGGGVVPAVGSKGLAFLNVLGLVTTAIAETTDTWNMSDAQRKDYMKEQVAANVERDKKANEAIKSFMPDWMSRLFPGEPGGTKTKVATEPVTASDTATQTQALIAQLAALDATIKGNIANEKLPGTAEVANAGLESQKTSLQNQLAELTRNTNKQALPEPVTLGPTLAQGAAQLAVLPTEYASTFTMGSAALNTLGPVINASAAAFGPTAGGGILAFASQFGATAGAAIAAAAAGVSIQLKPPAGAVNTGRLSTAE